ncbi:MAG: methyltransferase domain-containing protein [Alphaproteobacteria bacterium]|nr:methyltransferase domain-containing protein [Alphaproteobacteria bacterium]MBL6938785.1 methyltransferase domain-containing protein [Alphaproteobacteria bacterium]MBL7097858.1 methyltransferase domain-containing protein [Alphaproteobacteria bacterium]
MTDMQRQYKDSANLNARIAIHVKYGPPGKAFSVADTGLITANAKVLDIGCGPARFWAVNAAALPAGLELTLADQSQGMVDEAVQTVAAVKGKFRAVTGKVADVCALPFADRTFDVVTAMHMLYHASDKDRAVAEIARVLKPGGVLIATTNGNDNFIELEALTAHVFGALPDQLRSTSFSLESGHPHLERHFNEVAVHAGTDILRVTDAQDVVNFIRSYPPGSDATGEQLQRLDAELAGRMKAQDGIFPITRIAGYMVARGPRR